MFEELTPKANLIRLEEAVRRFWRREGAPEAVCAARRDVPSAAAACVIYQQPLAVAGQLWADQVRLLAAADLLARYHTMRGDAVYWQGGWAVHGLAVEVAVERALGPEVARYDLTAFNAACRQVASEGIRRGEALADRLGVWAQRLPEAAYAAWTPQAIGAVWGALRRLWEAGRLRYERRVVPTCPRCATPLSDAEAARRAVEVETQAVWLRLPWDGEPGAYLLAWTPTPWTLVGMVALAAHPEAGYALVELAGEEGQPPTRLLLAEAALGRALQGEYRLVRRLPGKALRGARYRPPFTFAPACEEGNRVALSAGLPLDQGSGFRPVTPAFDAFSLALAQAHGWPLPDLLDDWGGLGDAVTPWRGLSPLDAEPLLVEELGARGLLLRAETGARPRALCPYCGTPLLPLARDVWLVETGSGPWVVGRDRTWGAPLPVWTCERCGEQLCLAGLDDLAHRTGLDARGIDPHRPEVDRLAFPCEACGGTMRRVAPVVDAAFEAAVLPWTLTPRPGPADRSWQSLAVGLGDRDLGWLGDLTELAALVQGALAWERAVALPEGEDDGGGEPGRIPPADALRWAAYTDMTPEQAEDDFLRPLWELATLPGEEGGAAGNDLLDRWLLARLYQASGAMTEALDAGEPRRAAGELAALVEDLVGRYAAHRPGDEALGTLIRLTAPFAPHLAEAMHRRVSATEAQSVHLAAWPRPDPAWADAALLANTSK